VGGVTQGVPKPAVASLTAASTADDVFNYLNAIPFLTGNIQSWASAQVALALCGVRQRFTVLSPTA